MLLTAVATFFESGLTYWPKSNKFPISICHQIEKHLCTHNVAHKNSLLTKGKSREICLSNRSRCGDVLMIMNVSSKAR